MSKRLALSSIRHRLSHTVSALPPSGIRRFFDLVSTMDNVISLGVGEPDFVTPWKVRDACVEALEQGYTTYTSNSGLPALREAVAEYLWGQYQLRYEPEEEILITVGASEAIDLALRAILNPGDEVLVVEPAYISYAPCVTLAGGIPVAVDTDARTGFKPTAEQLERHITPRTKAIIFCFPNNPTGAALRKEELAPLAEVIRRHDLLVISDEIYGELTYEGKHVSIASLQDMKDRTVLISGMSKAFAMTGWRIGYACGHPEVIELMRKIHQYTMLCAPIMSQMAAVEALRNGLDEMREMVLSYKQRRNLFIKGLNQIGLPCHQPEGAFYAFPSIKETGLTSEEFAERLLFEAGVAVVPGNVFGKSGHGYIRCSYATSVQQITEALERMARFLQRLR